MDFRFALVELSRKKWLLRVISRLVCYQINEISQIINLKLDFIKIISKRVTVWKSSTKYRSVAELIFFFLKLWDKTLDGLKNNACLMVLVRIAVVYLLLKPIIIFKNKIYAQNEIFELGGNLGCETKSLKWFDLIWPWTNNEKIYIIISYFVN